MRHLWGIGGNKESLVFLLRKLVRLFLVRGCGLARRKQYEGRVSGTVQGAQDGPPPKSGLATVMSPGTLCTWASGQEVRPGCHPAKGCCAHEHALLWTQPPVKHHRPRAKDGLWGLVFLPQADFGPWAALLGRRVSEAGVRSLHDEHLGFDILVRILEKDVLFSWQF